MHLNKTHCRIQIGYFGINRIIYLLYIISNKNKYVKMNTIFLVNLQLKI